MRISRDPDEASPFTLWNSRDFRFVFDLLTSNLEHISRAAVVRREHCAVH